MSLERWFASLYSRQSLSSVWRLAARSLDSARQGYSTEKWPQGRCRGESSEEGNWWTTRWNYTHQGTLFLPSVPSPRSHLRPSGQDSREFIATQVRGFQRLGGGTAQLPWVGPPQVADTWAQTKTRRISEASVVTLWRPQQWPEREGAGPAKFLWWV